VELAKKFCVLHQRDVWKSANVEEDSSPAENAVIAASDSQQNACVMSKAIRQSIDRASGEADPEVTANDIRISQDMRNLVQTSQWDFSINMQEPKHTAAGGARAGIHLPGTTAPALNEPIAKSSSESICAIGASAVRDNNLGFWRSLAEMLKKWSHQRRLVEYRHNDRDLRPNAFL
jgi:hypothetical protein